MVSLFLNTNKDDEDVSVDKFSLEYQYSEFTKNINPIYIRNNNYNGKLWDIIVKGSTEQFGNFSSEYIYILLNLIEKSEISQFSKQPLMIIDVFSDVFYDTQVVNEYVRNELERRYNRLDEIIALLRKNTCQIVSNLEFIRLHRKIGGVDDTSKFKMEIINRKNEANMKVHSVQKSTSINSDPIKTVKEYKQNNSLSADKANKEKGQGYYLQKVSVDQSCTTISTSKLQDKPTVKEKENVKISPQNITHNAKVTTTSFNINAKPFFYKKYNHSRNKNKSNQKSDLPTGNFSTHNKIAALNDSSTQNLDKKSHVFYR